MANMTSAQGELAELQASRLSLVEPLLLGQFEGSFCCFTGGQNINKTSKDGFCDKSDAEILNSLKDWGFKLA